VSARGAGHDSRCIHADLRFHHLDEPQHVKARLAQAFMQICTACSPNIAKPQRPPLHERQWWLLELQEGVQRPGRV